MNRENPEVSRNVALEGGEEKDADMDAEIREKACCVLKLCGVYPRRQKSRENWVMLISKGGKAKRCFQDKDLDVPEVNNYVNPDSPH